MIINNGQNTSVTSSNYDKINIQKYVSRRNLLDFGFHNAKNGRDRRLRISDKRLMEIGRCT